ncbi:MAG TPA: ParB/RepB/Spo0J family partition protein, partial [bacterium]|nr:ParB/RepB/Spo0J family partition protein [bacterium]
MSNSPTAVSQPPEILMLPVDGLFTPPWNPRKFIDEGEMADLAAYVAKGGYVPRILVWKGDGKSVISGQRRLEAYRRLGKAHIEAELLDIPLEDARVLAITSNEGAEVYWLDKYESWEPFLTEGLTE